MVGIQRNDMSPHHGPEATKVSGNNSAAAAAFTELVDVQFTKISDRSLSQSLPLVNHTERHTQDKAHERIEITSRGELLPSWRCMDWPVQ